MDTPPPTWRFPSASESGTDASNQPRSKSVQVLEGSSKIKPVKPLDEAHSMQGTRSKSVEVKEEGKKRKSLAPQLDEPATIQTRSKSLEVKEESKKRKSLEPQRDDEAAKRPKPDVQHSKGASKTETSLFGPQPLPESAEKQPVEVHGNDDAGEQRRENTAVEKDMTAHGDARQSEQRKERDTSVDRDATQERQREKSTAESRQSIVHDDQSRANSDVIVVSNSKKTKRLASRQEENSMRKDGLTGGSAGDQDQGPLPDAEWEAKYDDLKDRANARIREKVAEINRLNKNLEELKENRNIWMTNCREAEHEFQQWKDSRKTFNKELRNELKALDQEERKSDMDRIKAQNKKDLQLKQQKHDLELRQMKQRMDETNEDAKEEKKKAAALMQEAKRKLRESKVETNSVIKEREQEIKEKEDLIYRLNINYAKANDDKTRVGEERKRFRDERDAAREEIKSQIDQREQLEKEKVELQAEILREREKSALFYKNKSEMSQQVANKRMAVVDLNRANGKLIDRVQTLEKELEAQKTEIAMLKEAAKAKTQPAPSSARMLTLEEELRAYKTENEMLKEAARTETQPESSSSQEVQQANAAPVINNIISTSQTATTSSTEEHSSGWHSLPPEPEVNFAPSPRRNSPPSNTENTACQTLDSDDAVKETVPSAQAPTTSTSSVNPNFPSPPSNGTMAITEATPPENFSNNIAKEAAPLTAPFNVSTAVDDSNKPGQQNEAFQNPEAQTLQADRDETMNEDVAGAGEDQMV